MALVKLAARRARLARLAGALLLAGAGCVVVVVVVGLRAQAVAVPAFLLAVGLLTGAVVAALFARIAHLDLEEVRDGWNGEGEGGGGWALTPAPARRAVAAPLPSSTGMTSSASSGPTRT